MKFKLYFGQSYSDDFKKKNKIPEFVDINSLDDLEKLSIKLNKLDKKYYDGGGWNSFDLVINFKEKCIVYYNYYLE